MPKHLTPTSRKLIPSLLACALLASSFVTASAPAAEAQSLTPGTFWYRTYEAPGPCTNNHSAVGYVGGGSLDPAGNIANSQFRGYLPFGSFLKRGYWKIGGYTSYLKYRDCINGKFYLTYYRRYVRYSCYVADFPLNGATYSNYRRFTSWQNVSYDGRTPCPL